MSSPSLTPEPPVLPIASGPIKGATAAHGKTVYLDSAPYPEVSGTGGYDAQTIAMLKEDYAGSDSELTAVLQYVYDNIMITEDESFSNAMLQIAIVEMTHLDMLGDAIRALGGDASFSDGEHFWQASSVDYTTDIEKMLKQDIESETKAIQTYQRQAEQTRNPSVRADFCFASPRMKSCICAFSRKRWRRCRERSGRGCLKKLNCASWAVFRHFCVAFRSA